MMMPMVGSPPQHAFLRRRHREKRQEKLEHSAGLERTMGKVAVIPGCHTEHSQVVAANCEYDPFQSNPGLKGPEAHHMNAHEGKDGPIVTDLLPATRRKGTVRIMVNSIHSKHHERLQRKPQVDTANALSL